MKYQQNCSFLGEGSQFQETPAEIRRYHMYENLRILAVILYQYISRYDFTVNLFRECGQHNNHGVSHLMEGHRCHLEEYKAVPSRYNGLDHFCRLTISCQEQTSNTNLRDTKHKVPFIVVIPHLWTHVRLYQKCTSNTIIIHRHKVGARNQPVQTIDSHYHRIL